MNVYEIPLNNTNQKFKINLGGKSYKLRTIYRLDTWYLDVMDPDETPLVCGLPLVMGDNLLNQHQHIIRGGLYVLNENHDEAHRYFELGSILKLYWSD